MRTFFPAVLMAAALAAPSFAEQTELVFAPVTLSLTPTLNDDPPAAPAQDAAAADPSFWKGWKGGVELGINGSEGNSQNLNVHAGVHAERKSDLYITKAALEYVRASNDGNVSSNRFQADVQNDWIFSKGSPWRYFLKGTGEYDDFQDWQERLTLTNGIGYAFIENEKTTLVGRAGVGVRRDFGGSDNRWHPEGLLGVDLSHKLTERQQLTFTAEYFPDFLDIKQYRARLKAGWEILVDPETKMSLKIGAEDRFDSNPGDTKKHNDLDYYLLLVWSF